MVWIWRLSRVHLQWSALVLSAKGKELKLSGKTSYREEKILLKLMRLFRTPLEVNIQLYHHIHSNSSNTWARGSHQPKPLQRWRCWSLVTWGEEKIDSHSLTFVQAEMFCRMREGASGQNGAAVKQKLLHVGCEIFVLGAVDLICPRLPAVV